MCDMYLNILEVDHTLDYLTTSVSYMYNTCKVHVQIQACMYLYSVCR